MSHVLSLITGFAPLPPYYSLGFHYSKWEPLSTDRLMEIYQTFNEKEIPVDMYWLDIDYTKDNKYFEFDEERFKDIEKYIEVIANN